MISLLPIVVVVFVLASIFKIAFIYHVLYVLVAVAVLARAWTTYAAGRLVATRQFEHRALWGESVTLRLTLRNAGRLPVPWLRARDRLPVELGAPGILEHAYALGPGESHEIVHELQCRQRGWYELGPLIVETGDPLGLNLLRREFATDQRLLVYPKVLPLAQLGLPSRTPFGDVRTHQPLYEDPARIAGVRDYQPGDSQRRIHWRTSAAVGRLQVKKLEPAMTLQTAIALDLSAGGYERGAGYYAAELAIVTAASVASHLIGLRQEVGLLTNGVDQLVRNESELYLAPRKGRGQLSRILDTLARIHTRTAPPIASALGAAMSGLSWGSTVVVVCGQDSPELADAALRLRRAGFAVAILVVSQLSQYRDQIGGAAALGIPVRYVWRESDLDGGETGPRRRGAHVGAS